MREAFERLETAWLALDLAVKRAAVRRPSAPADPNAATYEAAAIACVGVACDALEGVAALIERCARRPAPPPGPFSTHPRGS